MDRSGLWGCGVQEDVAVAEAFEFVGPAELACVRVDAVDDAVHADDDGVVLHEETRDVRTRLWKLGAPDFLTGREMETDEVVVEVGVDEGGWGGHGYTLSGH